MCEGPAGELCSGELGEGFGGRHFGACLPQCGEEFSQSSHRKRTGFMGHSGHCLTLLLRSLINTLTGTARSRSVTVSAYAHHMLILTVIHFHISCLNNLVH